MTWTQNPYRLLDLEDYIKTRNPRTLYDQHLRDLLVSRQPDRETFIRLIAAALGQLDTDTLTRKQMEALQLEMEARAVWDMTPTAYIAQKMNIGMRAAQRLLRRATANAKIKEHDQMFALTRDFLNDSERIVQVAEADIRKRMALMPRQCAGDGTPGCTHYAPTGRRLCHNCYQTYGQNPPRWLHEEMKRIENEHRRAAIRDLYEVDIALDDLENITSAAN